MQSKIDNAADLGASGLISMPYDRIFGLAKVRLNSNPSNGRSFMGGSSDNSSSNNQNSGWGGRTGAAVGSVVGGGAGSAVGGPFGGRVGAAGGGLAGYAIGDSIESGIRSGSSPDYGGYNAMGDYSGGPGTFGR